MVARDHCLKVMQQMIARASHASLRAVSPRMALVLNSRWRFTGKVTAGLLLDPGGAIMRNDVLESGHQVVISSQAPSGRDRARSHDGQSGSVIERIPNPVDLSQLPQWAKSRAQIDDESVPTGPRCCEEHDKWMAR
jgi:hypothetical protein